MSTNYPTSLDSFTDPASTDTLDGNGGAKPTVDHDAQHANANDAITAIETTVGVSGAYNFVQTAGGSVITVDSGGTGAPGIKAQFSASAAAGAIAFVSYDHLGNLISGTGLTGGFKVFGDRNQAGVGVSGPFMALDGTTSPPSILGPSTAYGAGGRIYVWPGTPAAGWVSGTTKVNDLWYNSSTGTWYQCTVSGAGSTAGTWITNFGIGAQAAYQAVTSSFSFTLSSSSSGTWFASGGTPPQITLPNDSNTYRVMLRASSFTSNQSQTSSVGIGTSTTHILAAQTSGEGAVNQLGVPVTVEAASVTGSGQTITVYAQYSSGSTAETLTVQAAAGNSTALGPCELAAYRVA